MQAKLLKFVFNLAISFLPFGACAFALRIHGRPVGGYRGLSAFWDHGELCLISIALVSAGIGDILMSNWERWTKVKVFIILLCVIFLLATATAYAQVAFCIVAREPYDIDLIKNWTPVLFFFSVCAGFACILLSREKSP